MASTRIRCLQVLAGLKANGLDAALYRPQANGAEPPQVLVLAKRYDEASLRQALALRQASGCRLLLDICDNHFHAEDDAVVWKMRAQTLRDACLAVDAVVVASPTLGEVVQRECGPAVHVEVVPDTLDRQAGRLVAARGSRAHWRAQWHALRWRAFAARYPVAPGRRLLWFGNHAAGYAEGGMADLGLITPTLTRHHQAQPLTLAVVSNSQDTYRRVRSGWPWPSVYLPWSDANFGLAVRQHAVALIPARRNPFTLCKTNNRLATAFINGLAVAADGLPSYLEFADLAALGDWDAGLAALMASPDDRAQRVAQAQARLEQHYSIDVICQRWQDVLGRTVAGSDLAGAAGCR